MQIINVKVLDDLRLWAKRLFDAIPNEGLKHNVLQALPFWLASFITGILAVGYAKIFELAENILSRILAWNSLSIFLLAPSGFLLSWWLVQRFAPYSKGSGIPQVMAAVDLSTPKERYKIKYLLSFRILLIKILSSVVLVVGGGAVGREGPTIQIAGSVFNFVNKHLPKWWPKISNRNMILTGAAAGLSAAFNTPLGGIVFAVEELAKIHISYFKTALFTAVIIAGLTAQWLAGSYLYLGYPNTLGVTSHVFLPVIFIAVLGGLCSSYLSTLMLRITLWRKTLRKTSHEIVFLLVISLLVASLAYFVNREILGSGKPLIDKILFSDHKVEAWYVPLFRMVGPALSFTSGGAGGIFAPALSAGASLGSFFSGIFELQPNETNVVVLAGMVAFLTGITRAPFTSAILVLEMTDRHSLIFYLMLAAMASSLISYVVSRYSLYDRLKHVYLDELEEKTKRRKIDLKDLRKNEG